MINERNKLTQIEEYSDQSIDGNAFEDIRKSKKYGLGQKPTYNKDDDSHSILSNLPHQFGIELSQGGFSRKKGARNKDNE